MKILLRYLKPYKWLVVLTLTLAAINIGFSLVDPILLGKLINLANAHQGAQPFNYDRFFFSFLPPLEFSSLFSSTGTSIPSRRLRRATPMPR